MYYFGLMLSLSAIYMIAGAGAAFSLKIGRINLAGEGLIYLGGFLCAILLDLFAAVKMPSFFAITFAFTICAIAGALVLIFCEFLYKFKHADFLLTTFITSSAIIGRTARLPDRSLYVKGRQGIHLHDIFIQR